METPFAREFDLDPLTYVLEHRQKLIVAALTVVRGYLTAGPAAAAAEGRMASFEDWDDLVRQPVAWAGREICPGKFGDPMDAVIAAQADDPELETLGLVLCAWQEVFGDK